MQSASNMESWAGRVFSDRFSQLRIQQKIRLITLASMLLLGVIFVGGSLLSSHSIMARSQRAMIEDLRSMDAYFQESNACIAARLANLDSSITVYQALRAAERGEPAAWNINALLKDLESIAEIGHIELYTADGTLFAGGQEDGESAPISEELLAQVCAVPGENVWVDDTPYSNTRADGISIYRAFRTQEEKLGIARVMVNMAALAETHSGLLSKNRFHIYLFTEKGNVLLPGELESAVLDVSRACFTGRGTGRLPDTYDYKGQPYQVRSLALEACGLFAVCSVSEARLMQDVQMMQMVILLIALLCSLTQFLTTSYMGWCFSKPIAELTDQVLQVDAGNLDVRSGNTSGDEIGVLARNFNAMLEHIQQLMREKVQDEKRRHELELLSLQTQITPHFLYNSLESVSALAQMGDNQGAFQMSRALSAFYRDVLSGGRNVVSVGEEVRLTENYLLIQSQRYKDDFDYQIDIDPRLMDAAIVKLTLQPLVENAIYHGIRNVRRRGLLKITGRLTAEGEICLSVWDNGKGMTETVLPAGTPGEKGDLILRQRGFGMYNADQRIRLYFGAGFGLHTASVPGEWTRVDIRLPRQPYEEFQRDFSTDR